MTPKGLKYRLPAEIVPDLNDMTDDERSGLAEVWNMVSQQRITPLESGKAHVRSVVFKVVSASDAPRIPLRPAPQVARIFALRLRWVSIAAVFVVAIGLVFSPSADQYRSPVGASTATLVSLPDGSEVSLAPGSRLSVLNTFGDTHRRLKLHGEAFFDVHEGAIPFVVETFDAATTVLGTSFNVKAWPGSVNGATKVVVRSGRVSVSTDDARILLNPGQASVAGSGKAVSVDTDVATYWMTGGFSFDNEPIANVIAEIERRYDIQVQAPVSIRLRPFSYSKRNAKDADDVIGDVAATIGVRYRRTANGFELYLK